MMPPCTNMYVTAVHGRYRKNAGTNASWRSTPATLCKKKTMMFATMSRRTHGVTAHTPARERK